MTCENDIPVWNLDSLYSSVDSKEYKDDLNKVQLLFSSLEQLIETAGKFIRESNSNFDLNGIIFSKPLKTPSAVPLRHRFVSYVFYLFSAYQEVCAYGKYHHRNILP